MVARTLVLFVVLALGSTRGARADHAKLEEARAALAEVQYDRARPLLVEALQAGTSTPVELAEIYRLSASTATVLGENELAEQYYRRWLAIDPTASLPDSVAPKLRQPFVAAQAYMAAHGRLSAKAQHRTGEDTVEVEIVSDPLAMVAGVALAAGEPRERIAVGADRRALVPIAQDPTDARVVVLDEFGNALLELAPDRAGTITTPVPRPLPPRGVSLARHPVTWAIPALIAGGVGIGFGIAARSADAELEDILRQSGDHVFADAEAARARRDRNALIANISFVAGGAFAVTAAIVYLTRPATAVVPTASSSSVGFAVTGAW